MKDKLGDKQCGWDLGKFGLCKQPCSRNSDLCFYHTRMNKEVHKEEAKKKRKKLEWCFN